MKKYRFIILLNNKQIFKKDFIDVDNIHNKKFYENYGILLYTKQTKQSLTNLHKIKIIEIN